MTTDTTALQERIARALYENAEYYGPEDAQPSWDSLDNEERGEWMEIAAAVLPVIARLEAQSDIRGRAVVIYRDRARKAEAERDWNIRSSRLAKEERIKANARAESAEARIRDLTQEVRDERGAALDAHEQIKVRDARIKAVEDVLSYADMGETLVTRSRIRRALDGDA